MRLRAGSMLDGTSISCAYDDAGAQVEAARLGVAVAGVVGAAVVLEDGALDQLEGGAERVALGRDAIGAAAVAVEMFRSRVSASVTGTEDLPSTVTVGATCTSMPRAQVPQLVLSAFPIPLERAALDRGRCDEDLGAGLDRARLDAAGPKRRNRAAEVPARKCGTAGAEGVLSARCLKDRRPQRREIVIQLLRRDGAGGGCA